MDSRSSMPDDSDAQQADVAASILEGLQHAETAEAFFKGLLRAQVERAEAMHGAVWLSGKGPGDSVRLLCEEPARVGQQAAEAWRPPLARQAVSVFIGGARHVERVSEPADRMLQGRPYWGVGLPVPVGSQVAAVVTLVLVGGEAHVLDFARVAAESVASQGLLYGTLQAGQHMQERYDELCRAWDLVASVNAGYPDPEHMALGFVNKAKEFLAVQRVSLGWVRGSKVKLAAISEQDYIDRRTNLSRALVAAMKEAHEAERPVYFPPPDDAEPAERLDGDPAELLPEHAALADLTDDHHVATCPMRARDGAVAVVVFERQERQSFTMSERRLQSIACDQLGPSMALARQNARGVFARTRDAGIALVERLAGKGHVVAKVVAATLLALAAVGIFGRWPLKISSNARLAPALRRVYAAPFDRAILRETMVLPGQLVKAGDPLLRFEDEELQLVLRETRSKVAGMRKKMDVLFSEQRVAEYNIAKAESEELAAQVELLEHRIRQALVRASFDGVVLSGDLRQEIGRPFQMGETLLEAAPLDELLLLAEVSQGDVVHVAVGQRGEFATKARPDLKLGFEVAKIRPMAEPRDGANVFVVEARVKNTAGWLRPGMEAASNIYAGKHNIAWAFTRKLINWVRYKLFL